MDPISKRSGAVEKIVELARISNQFFHLSSDNNQLHSQYEPVLLMVLSKSGIPVYDSKFSDLIDVNKNTLGSIITAITHFSTHFFSVGFDRGKFGQFTICMEETPAVRTCYIFKGESYTAQKKLKKFTQEIQSRDEIWRLFKHLEFNSLVIRRKENPALKELVDEIF